MAVSFQCMTKSTTNKKKKENPTYNDTKNKTKYLGINQTKDIKWLYSETYKLLTKKFKTIQTNGIINCIHGLNDLPTYCNPEL